jgi:hypothetical protein
MKNCTRCHVNKPFEAFYSSSTLKSGYMSHCKECESTRSKVKTKKYRDTRLVKAQEWRTNNKDAYLFAIQAWRQENPNRMKELYSNWAQANKDKVNAKWMKRDAAKKNRTPSWLTQDEHWMIEQAYDIAAKRTQMLGIQFHVDHIVPLQGKTVSGLHVPWNLQVIPAKLNQQKSNRFN